MGKGGGGQQTSTQTNTPWSEAAPHLSRIFGEAYDIYKNQPPSQFPGLTVAQRSMPTMLAEEMTLGRALGGSQLNDSARGVMQNTVDGNYLDITQNPKFSSALGQISDRYRETVAPQTDAAFSRSGAFGGSAHQNQMGINQRELSRGMNDMAASMYDQERNRQMAATGMAPGFASQDYNEIGKVAAVGDQRDAYNQSLLNDAVQKYGFDANKSRQNLSDYLGFVSGASSGTGQSSTTQPNSSNAGAGILGSALSLGSMGSQMGLFSGLGGSAASTLPWLSAGTLPFASTGIASTLPWLAASDSALKENIEPLGKENGHNVYRFTYKDDPDHTPYIGVMAQEVQQTHPHAVMERNGHLVVDYSAIGVKFREAV